MKGRRRVVKRSLIVLAIVLALPGALVYPSWRSDIRCFENLRALDHTYNCPDAVSMAKSEGTDIDENGRWNRDAITVQKHRLRCPISGEEYQVEFIAGKQPVCPTHGDLMARFQYVTHGGPPTFGIRPYLIVTALAIVAVSLVVTLFWFILTSPQKKNEE